MSAEWYPHENALYEVDEECLWTKLNPVLNYFMLLLCLYYS